MTHPLDPILDELADRLYERFKEKPPLLLGGTNSGEAPGPWLRLKEAAKHVSMGYPELTRRVARGEIPYHVIPGQEDTGRNRRIHVEDLDEWMGRYKAREAPMLYGRRRKIRLTPPVRP